MWELAYVKYGFLFVFVFFSAEAGISCVSRWWGGIFCRPETVVDGLAAMLGRDAHPLCINEVCPCPSLYLSRVWWVQYQARRTAVVVPQEERGPDVPFVFLPVFKETVVLCGRNSAGTSVGLIFGRPRPALPRPACRPACRHRRLFVSPLGVDSTADAPVRHDLGGEGV